VIRENFFVVGSGHGAVALLGMTKQALFRGEKSSLPIDFNGTAFEHDPCFAVSRADFTGMGSFGHTAANFFVILEIGIFGPGIETPSDGGEFRPFFKPRGRVARGHTSRGDEGAAGVASPHPVGRPAVEAQVVGQGIRFGKNLSSMLFSGQIVDDQLDSLMPPQMTNNFSIDPGDGFKFSRPIAAVVRPCQPGGGVRLPFRGHSGTVSMAKRIQSISLFVIWP